MPDVSFEFGFNFPDWHREALCQEHPEVEFVPERGESGRPAKALCQKCLSQSECLAWAPEQARRSKGYGAARRNATEGAHWIGEGEERARPQVWPVRDTGPRGRKRRGRLVLRTARLG
jgi:hypothetical protein